MNNLKCVHNRQVEVESEDGGLSECGLELFEGESRSQRVSQLPFLSPAGLLSFSPHPLAPRRPVGGGDPSFMGERAEATYVSN